MYGQAMALAVSAFSSDGRTADASFYITLLRFVRSLFVVLRTSVIVRARRTRSHSHAVSGPVNKLYSGSF